MVLLIIGIAAIFLVAMGAFEFVRRAASKQAIDLAKDFSESNKRLIDISGEVLKSNKDLLNFIDKNIKERVIYANPENPYNNETKFDQDQDTVEEDDDAEEMGADELEISMAHDKNNKESEGNK
jgi:hypothetical protein